MTNSILGLNLSTKELAAIGAEIGADVPFFVYGYSSANVTGIGEIVEEYKEAELELKLFTPKVECSTKEIFDLYSQNFFQKANPKDLDILLNSDSRDILDSYDARYLNDLFEPAKTIYPMMESMAKERLGSRVYFSGSGSSFFTVSR
jgi:4-diphosphocytidyl-2-C-methyl-D-erythritol kinase